ncbi:MAG TPA: CTP synthase (glutamine hydrolyzing) [Patescibacteria group bacterium]|nr:CTP synthase (glutamine hydrolyzing) [Patescibacteria group bacterium]
MKKRELEQLASKTEEHEFYTPIPDGYKKGKTKFVIVTGTVMSGLGKGIFSSSLSKLLENQGLKCMPIKMEGYLNIDSGTLNPYRHGEVFVLDDGTECDMDLGTYERMMDKNLNRQCFVTNGQIFSKIFERERKGEYLGRDVQFIPHVTGEIKRHLRELAMSSGADVVLVEVGGTIGDIENSHYVEALRELSYEEGRGNVCFAALTYVLEPGFLGEQKSKAAQLGIRLLMEKGIHPDIIACRAENPVTEKVKEKISIYTNVPVERVFSMHDVESIYLIPKMMREEKLEIEVMKLLGLDSKAKEDKAGNYAWDDFTQKVLKKKKNKATVGIAGKYTGLRDSYASIIKALEHCGAYLDTDIDIKWIETTKIENGGKPALSELKSIDALIVPGGFGKRGTEGKIECVRYARENGIPYLGLCLGFQIALIEFARNVCGLKNANSTEMNKETPYPVVDILPGQKNIDQLGGSMRLGGRDIDAKKDSQVYKLYGSKTTIHERFRHRYECNPKYIKKFEENGIIFSGRAPGENIMQILELKDHPFFMASQFHPEFTSRPLSPNPLFVGLVEAAIKLRK